MVAPFVETVTIDSPGRLRLKVHRLDFPPSLRSYCGQAAPQITLAAIVSLCVLAPRPTLPSPQCEPLPPEFWPSLTCMV